MVDHTNRRSHPIRSFQGRKERPLTCRRSGIVPASPSNCCTARAFLVMFCKTNSRHANAGAAFGGGKQIWFRRETHKIIPRPYQQTKNRLVSYIPKGIGASSRAVWPSLNARHNRWPGTGLSQG